MSFKFKNMSQYVRNVVEPLITACNVSWLSKLTMAGKTFDSKLQNTTTNLQNQQDALAADLRAQITALQNQINAQNTKINSLTTIPVGTVVIWLFSSNPSDAAKWLDCHGQTITQAAYPELYAKIGSKIPDLRGLFLRGYGSQTHTKDNGTLIGNTATVHASSSLGTIQGDSIRNITGDISRALTTQDPQEGGAIYIWQLAGNGNADPGGRGRYLKFDASRVTPTSNEIRPANMATRFLIRAKP